jgi:hypothetical protein
MAMMLGRCGSALPSSSMSNVTSKREASPGDRQRFVDRITASCYAILGVPHDATQETVKKAYLRLARQHHLDTNAGSPSSERRFKRIVEAYSVLSDPISRPQYDAIQPKFRGRAVFDHRSPSGPSDTSGPSEDLLGAPWALWWWRWSLRWSAALWSPAWASQRR